MLSNTQQTIIKTYKIDITSCVIGDRVLIEWDRNFSNYCLVLDSSSIHVLNADCVVALGLPPACEANKRSRAVGVVVEKEYCYAKKVNIPPYPQFSNLLIIPCVLERESLSVPTGNSFL